MRNEPKTFVVFGPGYWGIGESLEEAAQNCRKAGCGKSEKITARLYYGAKRGDVVIFNDGGVEYPQTAESILLLEQVRLGGLILK